MAFLDEYGDPTDETLLNWNEANDYVREGHAHDTVDVDALLGSRWLRFSDTELETIRVHLVGTGSGAAVLLMQIEQEQEIRRTAGSSGLEVMF